MTRRTEFWWIQWDEREGVLPLEPARIGFDGERPATIEEIGLGIERDFATCGARLIERVLPAGRAAAAVAKLEQVDFTRYADTMQRIARETIDILKEESRA